LFAREPQQEFFAAGRTPNPGEPALQVAAVQAFIQDFWRQRGVETDLWELDIDELRSHRAFTPVEYEYKGRPNQVIFSRGRAVGVKFRWSPPGPGAE
jgi:hypothetical protein